MYHSTNFQDTSFFVTSLLSHLLIAFPLWKMAVKKNVAQPWFAWVPVLNGLIALKLAKKPLWWIILFFIPLVNVIIGVFVMMTLCEEFGINKWWGLLVLVSPAVIILFYVLAFMEHGAHVESPSGAAPPMAQTPAPAPKETIVTEVESTRAVSEKNDPDLSTPDAPKSE